MLAGGRISTAAIEMPDMRFADRSSPRLVIRSMIRVSARNSRASIDFGRNLVVQNSTVHPAYITCGIFWQQG